MKNGDVYEDNDGDVCLYVMYKDREHTIVLSKNGEQAGRVYEKSYVHKKNRWFI